MSAVVKVAIGRCGATALDSNLSGLSIYGHPLTELERTPEVVAVSGVHRGKAGGR
ncbi:unnamed protein product, partial [marine sediment metagenome]